MKKSHIKKMIAQKREKDSIQKQNQENKKVLQERYNRRDSCNESAPSDFFLNILTSGLSLGG